MLFFNLNDAIVAAFNCEYEESRSRQTSLTGLPAIAGLTEYSVLMHSTEIVEILFPVL